MPRIPYPNLDDLPAASKQRLNERLPLNIYRMLCTAPTFFPGWMDLGRAILHEAKLDPKLRELAILRVGYLGSSAYEMHQHRKIALVVGLTPDQVEGISCAIDPALYNSSERLVLSVTDQVVSNVKADDALFAESLAVLGHRETIELLVTIGFYMMVVRLIENTGIEIETDGGPSLDEVKRTRDMTLTSLAREAPADAAGN